MTNDLISREAAIKAVEMREPLLVGDKTIRVESVKNFLMNRPAVDAEPVVHGRWKYYHKQNRAICTECSFERDLDADFGRAVSCPNCGAKMDGGNDNG